MEKRIGTHDKVNMIGGAVKLLAKSPHSVDRVKNARASAIDTRFRERGYKPWMLTACQRHHGKAMLECAKLRRGFVRWVAGGNEENAVEMKTPLGGAGHGNMARMNGVKGSAKKRDVPAFGRLRPASGGRFGPQICSADITISPRPKLSSLLHPLVEARRHSVHPARMLRSLLAVPPAQAAPARRPCRGRVRLRPFRWPTRWRKNRASVPRNIGAACPAANGPWWHRASSLPRSLVSPLATR